MVRPLRLALLVTLLAVLSAAMSAAAADTTIYKVRLKDGSIAFTDRPPPDATILEKREFDSAPAAPAAAAPAPATSRPSPAPAMNRPSPSAAEVDARLKQRAEEQGRKDAAVADAERALAQAKDDLEKGRDPREGDIMGTARKGFVRHSPAYEERVRALEKAVADAEARLAAARDAAR